MLDPPMGGIPSDHKASEKKVTRDFFTSTLSNDQAGPWLAAAFLNCAFIRVAD
jgi:hypothetical protein